MNYNQIRRTTKEIHIGRTAIGGNQPIAIQSMTNTDTHDKEATLRQILALEEAGCDIVRITVPDLEAADTIPFLKESGTRKRSQDKRAIVYTAQSPTQSQISKMTLLDIST